MLHYVTCVPVGKHPDVMIHNVTVSDYALAGKNPMLAEKYTFNKILAILLKYFKIWNNFSKIFSPGWDIIKKYRQ